MSLGAVGTYDTDYDTGHDTMPTPKPEWPYKNEMPMIAYANGQWGRKYKGKSYYFGKWDDPQAARDRARIEWPRIVDGRPRRADTGFTSLQVSDLCRLFLDDRDAKCRAGKLSPATLDAYTLLCRELVACFGKTRQTQSLGPTDFARLLRTWDSHSPFTVRKRVVATRTVFRWGTDMDLISAVKIGRAFRGPTEREVRLHRADIGEQLVDSDQFDALLATAGPTYRAICYLAVNGGYGPTDICELPADKIDLDSGWINYRREKTGAERKVPLWPETIDAMRGVVMPSGAAFRTNKGRPIIPAELGKVFSRAAEWVDFPGTFYWFRYTFSTYATEIPDDHARDIIMGHTIKGVPRGYVQRFPEDRLLSVSNHVRSRVLHANP